MAAERKEVVVDADGVNAEHLGPDRSYGRFSGRVRGDKAILTCQGWQVRCGQGLAVDLAVGGEGQRLEQDEGGRGHVVGQLLAAARCAAQVPAMRLSLPEQWDYWCRRATRWR